jgi:hypothetical protein
VRARLKSLHLPFLGWFERQALRAAIQSGPPYRPSHDRIVIDLTAMCDMGCVDCNRSCGSRQAPAVEHLSLAQVQHFLDETQTQRRHWRVIQLEGGEPTLHPQFREIVLCLDRYRRGHAPATVVKVISNGASKLCRATLAALPRSVEVFITAKRQPEQASHCAFNLAPVDLPELVGTDSSQGCFLPAREGLGLTRYGYYPHPVCGGIDRVFGFDIGRRSLPRTDDDLREQFARLCPLCGLFRFFTSLDRQRPDIMPKAGELALRGAMSPTWVRAYARYRERPPQLTLY